MTVLDSPARRPLARRLDRWLFAAAVAPLVSSIVALLLMVMLGE